jgi:hypothetical protein
MTEHRPLSAAEQHVLDVTITVYREWIDKPKGRERAGALSAIGSIWNRLGWTMPALEALEHLAKQRR